MAAEQAEFRCPSCNKLICKVSDVVGIVVEAKCPRCDEVTVARLEADDD